MPPKLLHYHRQTISSHLASFLTAGKASNASSQNPRQHDDNDNDDTTDTFDGIHASIPPCDPHSGDWALLHNDCTAVQQSMDSSVLRVTCRLQGWGSRLPTLHDRRGAVGADFTLLMWNMVDWRSTEQPLPRRMCCPDGLWSSLRERGCSLLQRRHRLTYQAGLPSSFFLRHAARADRLSMQLGMPLWACHCAEHAAGHATALSMSWACHCAEHAAEDATALNMKLGMPLC
eukprot:349702-Chlamydomonas_euryale.AAC.7